VTIKFFQDYPAEGKVSNTLWGTEGIAKILERYNPLGTEYNEDGACVWDQHRTPILYDPQEQYGSMLRVCAKLGWTYVCKAATKKLALFINKNWQNHLLISMKASSDNVCAFTCFFYINLHAAPSIYGCPGCISKF
jgi:hypothetical protein